MDAFLLSALNWISSYGPKAIGQHYSHFRPSI